MLAAVATLAAIGAGVTGCGKVSSSVGVDGGPTANEACAALAQTTCAKRMTCSNGGSITRAFGEMSTCIGRETMTCTDALAAPHTGNTPAMVEACITAYATLACNDFFDGKLPAACTPAGSLPDGQACTFHGQCASGFCSGIKNALCGSCAPAPAPGASCASSGCGHGQNCVGSTMTCQNPGLLNGACDQGTPCGNGFNCVTASSAATSGTCQVAIAEAGSACGGTLPTCNLSLGLFCGGAAGAKTCMAITYVGSGMPCGPSATAFPQCIAGGCFTATGAAATGETGTCKSDAMDDAVCDTVLGPDCMPPARCVTTGTGSAGTCVIPTGASCG